MPLYVFFAIKEFFARGKHRSYQDGSEHSKTRKPLMYFITGAGDSETESCED